MLKQTWTIGSDEACDIVVAKATVSAQHCRLEYDVDGFVITDLGSSNGTYVNDQRIQGPTQVSDQDQITLGRSQNLPWPVDVKKHVMSQPTKTQTTSGATSERIITIGRGGDNTVRLSESNVSTHHARLVITGDEIFIEDLGSTNGTAVGKMENKISRSTVHPTDVIFLGSTSYRVDDLIHRARRPEITPSKTSAEKSTALGMKVGLGGVALLILMTGVWITFGKRGDDVVMETMQPQKPDRSENAAGSDLEPAPESLASERSNEDPSGLASDTHATPTQPMTVAEQLSRSLFLVVCSDPERETPFRVGTGFAIDSGHVVTSASVIDAIGDLRRNGFGKTVLISPASGKEYPIETVVKHPRYDRMNEMAREAQSRHDAIFDELESQPPTPESFEAVKEALLSARMKAFEWMDRKAAFDVALISLGQSVESWLELPESNATLRPNQRLSVTGFAFDVQDPYFDVKANQVPRTMDVRVSQLLLSDPTDAQRLFGKGDADQLEFAYIGSPVLNAEGRVVGVYSRPFPREEDSEADFLFDAALFQRIAECDPNSI